MSTYTTFINAALKRATQRENCVFIIVTDKDPHNVFLEVRANFPIESIDTSFAKNMLKFNGHMLRVVTEEQKDSIRGLYIDGVLLDGLFERSPIYREVIRPALLDRTGFMMVSPTTASELARMVVTANHILRNAQIAEVKAKAACRACGSHDIEFGGTE